MSLFEILVLAGIFLHLVFLVWVLLWIKDQLDRIGNYIDDGFSNVKADTYEINKKVRDFWYEQQTKDTQKFVDKKRAIEEDKERARQELMDKD